MLLLILSLTSILSMLSGLIVMALGNWKSFHLKFAGVALSTATAIFLSYIHLTHIEPDVCNASSLCVEYISYGAIRNLCFIIFHIAVGRDAIKFKQTERRSGLHIVQNKRSQHRERPQY